MPLKKHKNNTHAQPSLATSILIPGKPVTNLAGMGKHVQVPGGERGQAHWSAGGERGRAHAGSLAPHRRLNR